LEERATLAMTQNWARGLGFLMSTGRRCSVVTVIDGNRENGILPSTDFDA
jgi:hypothetical protein